LLDCGVGGLIYLIESIGGGGKNGKGYIKVYVEIGR
jgi:hypothetical protein